MIQRLTHLGCFALVAAIVYSQSSVSDFGHRIPIALRHDSEDAMIAQEEARILWDEAIAAKGGRERLYSVRNVLISSHQGYITHK